MRAEKVIHINWQYFYLVIDLHSLTSILCRSPEEKEVYVCGDTHTMRAEVVNSHTWPLMESSSVHQRVKMTLCLSVCVCQTQEHEEEKAVDHILLKIRMKDSEKREKDRKRGS